ncbi:glycosyltransferase [Sulfuriroseicoccus oceanibius]|uniref:Glycosyltransferase n=1 Tax=Sulfuriroseicoccus oceanibius TaxID=2707525 RepID=A0A6B3L388_9BACT|nr:glycosyltransferase [Sulfuriroseicoccus oceanibius]QQL45548.1 glycosyltransferase [Sulfuriroseicoccus oceanibius]
MPADPSPSPAAQPDRPQPVVASYVHTFCKPEMRHIYRQITGLETWRPHVITHKWENPETFHLHKRWVTVLPKYPLRFFRRLWCKQLRDIPWQLSRDELRRFLYAIQTHDAQVVHIYFGHMAMHLLPLIEASPWPVVVSFHGADAGVGMEKKAWRQAMERVFEKATAILARSQSLVDELIALGCPAEKVQLSRTAIPLEQFAFTPREEPTNNAFIWLQACRLIEKKGLPTTLTAFAEFHRQFPNAKLRIAGDGPMKDELDKLATDLGIADSIEWLGFLSEKQFLHQLQQAHFFAHPSQTGRDGNQEGVPNSMLEAMASGAPVLATRHGGIPEAVTDGHNGVLVDERDAQSLAARAIDLAQSPQLRATMATAARHTIETMFSPEAQRTQLESLYTHLAAGTYAEYRDAVQSVARQ